MKRDFPRKNSLLLTLSALACAACATFDSSEFDSAAGGGKSMSTASAGAYAADQYGNDFSIQQAIGAIKRHGTKTRVSSRAIRLPERPLGEVTVSSFAFPASCGGHEFRVIEADGAQILEYAYVGSAGGTHQVRDYVSGSSPFVQPGLWTAYDHTADSIASMTSQFDQQGAGMHGAVYSKGLVTNLPALERREYGNAYQQALSDVYSCRDM